MFGFTSTQHTNCERCMMNEILKLNNLNEPCTKHIKFASAKVKVQNATLFHKLQINFPTILVFPQFFTRFIISRSFSNSI